ncbi:hypothetical protein TCE0_033f09060 [Talaromyces pinophilus]|uniref:Uncharacterized protein n=1 Tax=Talaromyces pinophilus TaxID=128442 RepID=A0A6V8HAC0_TALPI|nr:hypothetical protein TCE0_033f09060 [Talaromyces pinophilus]
MPSSDVKKVFVLGDSVQDTPYHVSNFLGKKQGPILASFLEHAGRALRMEVSKLPSAWSSQIVPFSSVHGLCSLEDQSKLHPSLVFTLTCISQLAYLINHVEQDDGWFPDSANTLVTGIDAGVLVASAFCSSRNLTQLLTSSVEAVRVAFHTALVAIELSNTVDPLSSSSAWTISVSGLSLDKATTILRDFSAAQENSVPLASKPYISSIGVSQVSISGPPRVLETLKSVALQGYKIIYGSQIPVAFHAPHLYSEGDVNRILANATGEKLPVYIKNLEFVTPVSGTISWSQTFPALIKEALSTILLEPTREDLVSQKISTWLHSSSTSSIQLRTLSSHDHLADLDVKLHNASTQIPHNASNTEAMSRSKIAIIGFSGRFPEADNLSEFWKLLYEGRDVHKVVPERRWDAATHVDVTGKRKNTSATPYGCWLDNAGLFDAKFFHLSPREAPQVDPAQRLALMTAYEAIEQAGIVPGSTPSTKKDRVGVYYGVTSNDWMETNSSQNIDTYMIPGGNRAFIPGRVNYFFKFSGPSYSTDTACSSSLASMHGACNALWRGDVDTAIVGGTNVLTNPDFTAGLDRGHFLSRTGNCKAFDDSADGYCRGEGVVTLILKRYEDAIADKDPIHGLILSAYTNHSADAESITRPHGGAQKAIFNKLLYETGSKPYDVGYIEMHGTGTQAGDAEEMRSVVDIFAPEKAASIRTEEQALYLGSVKANIGHGEAASGVSALAKILLMMKHNTIPPHCGVKTKLNTKFPAHMSDHNVRIATKPTPWNRPANGTRKVLVNNFSAAGGNSAIIVEDAPIETPLAGEESDVRSQHVVAISAKSTKSLQGNVESLLEYLDATPSDKVSLPTLSYTTTARRIHHMYRVMLTGSTLSEIRGQLTDIKESVAAVQRVRTAPRSIFAFTGQGSQYPGMGKQFYESISSFRSDLDRYNQLCQKLGFPPFVQIITDDKSMIENYSPVVTQLATTCLEMALGRLWRSWGIIPAAVVGHSLGEYAALHIAGVLSESDTIYLVGKRAELLQECCTPNTHSMLAVKASVATVQSSASQSGCEIACVNGPEDVVISGKSNNIKKVQDILASHKIKSTLLRVPYAFHSSQVDPILEKLGRITAGVTVSPAKIPTICATNATVVKGNGTFDAQYFVRHCRDPVNMFGAIQSARQEGLANDSSIIIEVGPQPIVSKMFNASLKMNLDILPSLQRGQDAWKLLTGSMKVLYTRGAEVEWREYHRDFPSSQRVLELPNYSWELKDYWLQYTNDWSLYKGSPLEDIPQKAVASGSLPVVTPPPKPAFKKLQSSTIHKILEETFDNQAGKLVVEGDISRPDLNPLVQGHKVNGIPLCTPSVYAELALSIGTYLMDRYQPGMKERHISVSDMTIEKALIAQNSGSQFLRTTVAVDWKDKIASLAFESYNVRSFSSQQNLQDQILIKNQNQEASKKPARHATCKIVFRDAVQEKGLFDKKSSEIKQRMSTLKQKLTNGDIYKFNRSMIYKMIGSLAQFDSKYTGLKEIVLDSQALEAYGSAEFSHINAVGEFFTHPAYIDALSQIGGFVMNCNDSTNLDEEVFMNHGWDAFGLFENLSKEKAYDLHVSMHEVPGNKYKGDVAIFEGGNVVGYFQGITLQGVAKRALQYILAREKDLGSKTPKKANPAEAKAAVAAAPAHTRISVTPSTPALAPAPVPAQPSVPVQVPVVIHDSVKPHPSEEIGSSRPVSTTKTSRKVDTALRIIAEESGYPVEEMIDNLEWAELGVDSLLILIVAGRLEEELGLLVDSAAFSSMPTIQAFKEFITDSDPDATIVETPKNTHPAQQVALPGTVPLVNGDIKFAPTPPVAEKPVQVAAAAVPSFTPAAAPITTVQETVSSTSNATVSTKDGSISNTFKEVLQIISEESGMEIEDLTDDTFFGDVGVDSLLSLIITGRMKDELSIDLESENSFFVDFPTMKDVRLTTSTSGIATPPSETSSSYKPVITEVRPASSIVLQGKPRQDSETLFLLPDGGGSAASYSRFPRIKPDLAVIGLNCPYVRNPEEMMTVNFEDLIESYITEIKKRQPSGPYNIGGWSSGGIMAYRVTQRLIQEGEEVTRLVLIDSPPPLGLDRLPQRFYDFCGSVNLFDASKNQSAPQKSSAENGALPATLLAHFKSNIEVLHDYYADPLPEGLTPLTTIIYAPECVFDGVVFPKLPPGPDDTEGMKFLTEKRTDFSGNAWAGFFPGETVNVEVIDGATHFSLMGTYAAETAAAIGNAMR